jgi:hypothetical protein
VGCARQRPLATAQQDMAPVNESIAKLFPSTLAAVQAMLAQVRRMLRETLPDATEIFYHGCPISRC